MAYIVVRKLTAEYHEDACAYKEEKLLMKYVLTYLPTLSVTHLPPAVKCDNRSIVPVVYIKSTLPYDTYHGGNF